jgi:hypothetical protein
MEGHYTGGWEDTTFEGTRQKKRHVVLGNLHCTTTLRSLGPGRWPSDYYYSNPNAGPQRCRLRTVRTEFFPLENLLVFFVFPS